MIVDEFRLDGKIALVTGGTKGLGRAIATALAEAGADIAVVSRSPNPEMEKEILALGRRYFHYSADLSVREQMRKVIPAVAEAMGDINILVNNSGIVRSGPALDYTEKDWDATLEVNLTAPFLLSQAASRIMMKTGKGKIINMASVLSFQGASNAAYAVSKHGVVGLTRALANTWAGKGVNVNGIAPGWFITDMNAPLRKDTIRYESMTKRIPAGRWGVSREISGAAVYLASPASDFVHGEILIVDGGWMTG